MFLCCRTSGLVAFSSLSAELCGLADAWELMGACQDWLSGAAHFSSLWYLMHLT